MRLTVLERMISMGLLPAEGDILTLRIRAKMIDKIGLTAEEFKEYEVVQANGNVKWRNDLPQEKEIDLDPAEIGLLKDALKKKNDDKKLTPEMVGLYEKVAD